MMSEQGKYCRPRSAPLKVIVDVDAGADDAMALLMILAAEACQNVEIIAISCVQGNTTVDNVCTNVLRLLETVERLDIPVYRGAETPLIPFDIIRETHLSQYHGKDGFGDIQFRTTPSLSAIQEENAVSALNQLTSRTHNLNKISLLCLGPLTNIALAIKTYKNFAKNIKDIFIMGGNSTGIGNVTSAAEFNFYNDPEAAHIVLETVPCPVTLVPWETCLDIPMTLEWRFNVLGGIQNKQMELLNYVEKSICERLKCTKFYTCDPLVTAVLLCPEVVLESKEVHLTVELCGKRTRGQAVLDHLNDRKPNVKLIQKLNIDLFKEMLLWAAGHSLVYH